ncbi:MAG: EAL domain-containing protein [Aquabacterium sp.]
MLWRLLLTTSLLLAALPVWAGTPALDVSRSTGRGEEIHMAAFRATAEPTEAGPVAPPDPGSPWVDRSPGTRSLGFDHRGFWTRAVLRNTSESPRLGWVVVSDAYTDHVDCFVMSDANEAMVYRMGDRRPFDARPISYPGAIVPINVFPGGEVTLYCLLRNNGLTATIFQYWEPQQYAMVERERAFARALSYGALCFAVIVSIVLALVNANVLSILMIADVLPVLLATAAREGDAFQLLWPGHPEFNVPPYMMIMVGAVTASLVFRWILRLDGWERRVIQGVLALSVVLLPMAVAVPSFAPRIAAFVQIVALLYPVFLIVVCGRRWHEGPVPRLLLMGMLVQHVALIVNAMGVLGLVAGSFSESNLYASVVKAVALAAALFYRMKLDRIERAKALADHTRELEQRVAYEAQLRHAVSHHPRYGMPNQAMLEEAVRARFERSGQLLTVWIVQLNRFGFLESILPPDTLTSVVKVYAEELQHWFSSPARVQAGLMSIEGVHRIAALDDSTLAFVTASAPGDTLVSDLEAFLTRRFEWQGIFVAWDPRVGFSHFGSEQASEGTGVTDEARIALQWSSAHSRIVRFDAERMKREQLAYGLTLDLEGAIERGELLLHYQPKVTLATRRTDSLEALVRWRHPQRGMIPPGAFIAEAEATGAINRLTMWAIGEAARFLLTLPDPHVRVSVNITAFDLATPRFVDKVLEILARESCPPSRLILEVTESAALSDRDRATQILSRLRQEGVKIALDDFGTGYSSLGILQEMPLDEMKVDRSFVTDIAGFGRKQAVLQAMIEVGHRLGLMVTIEGVEHAESVDWLARNGCDVVQGYYFSRPLEADAARHWLSQPLSKGEEAPAADQLPQPIARARSLCAANSPAEA